jgi:hypothetical protein
MDKRLTLDTISWQANEDIWVWNRLHEFEGVSPVNLGGEGGRFRAITRKRSVVPGARRASMSRQWRDRLLGVHTGPDARDSRSAHSWRGLNELLVVQVMKRISSGYGVE